MKISKGRGIQFFKHPVFMLPSKFVTDTYKVGKNKISSFVDKNKKGKTK
jgi:hypothetical protein